MKNNKEKELKIDEDKNTKPSKINTHVGPNEFEESRSDNIRMKPQPLKKTDKK